MPYVYVVRCADGSLYTGWATDVQRRVQAHNRGLGARYTRWRAPVTLVYTEMVPNRSAALRREAAIKRYRRARKLALCVPTAMGSPESTVMDPNMGCVRLVSAEGL